MCVMSDVYVTDGGPDSEASLSLVHVSRGCAERLIQELAGSSAAAWRAASQLSVQQPLICPRHA